MRLLMRKPRGFALPIGSFRAQSSGSMDLVDSTTAAAAAAAAAASTALTSNSSSSSSSSFSTSSTSSAASLVQRLLSRRNQSASQSQSEFYNSTRNAPTQPQSSSLHSASTSSRSTFTYFCVLCSYPCLIVSFPGLISSSTNSIRSIDQSIAIQPADFEQFQFHAKSGEKRVIKRKQKEKEKRGDGETELNRHSSGNEEDSRTDERMNESHTIPIPIESNRTESDQSPTSSSASFWYERQYRLHCADCGVVLAYQSEPASKPELTDSTFPSPSSSPSLSAPLILSSVLYLLPHTLRDVRGQLLPHRLDIHRT